MGDISDGVFSVPIEIGDLASTRFDCLEAMVDTGASYSILPASFLHRLGIVPYRTLPLTLADGSVIEYELGHAMVRIDGNAAPTIVVFGAEDMRVPLLGAHALEGLALKVNPLDGRLETVAGYL